MRLLFVADGRSPTALNWIKYWIEMGHDVHLISTYPCNSTQGLASFHILPVAFGGMATAGPAGTGVNKTHQFGSMGRLRGLFRPLRYFLGPLSLPVYRKRFLSLVSEIQPDIVHALRIPFEGMLAGVLPGRIPLVVSIWGNDITLHAHGSFLMARLTRATLKRADGLLADTNRDIRLAHESGFSQENSALVVPGSGGIRLNEMDGSHASESEAFPEELPDTPIVVNPRGQRPGSLRQDVFFQAIPLVLEKIPRAVFICPSLARDVESERWVNSLGIKANTRLWPRLNQFQLWALLRKAQVYVSPSLHDGTPNSLLEAMACGCYPVVGDIESMREWITDDNGLLVDASSPRSVANGIIKALETPSLQAAAKNKNALIIAERAEYWHCMAMVEAFYREILTTKGINSL